MRRMSKFKIPLEQLKNLGVLEFISGLEQSSYNLIESMLYCYCLLNPSYFHGLIMSASSSGAPASFRPLGSGCEKFNERSIPYLAA